MEGIFKKDNVYVVVRYKNVRNDIQEDEMDTLVYSHDDKYRKEGLLYGGRVIIKKGFYYGTTEIRVDGISIKVIKESELSLTYSLDIEKATAYLNQIENLGVDSFLENYKQQLIDFKKEIEEKLEKEEQQQSVQFDEERNEYITSLKNVINQLICVIFCLLINMNAGLDNQCYTDAYNEIINLYF